jgi:type II secretory pathway pseudopilin PulG
MLRASESGRRAPVRRQSASGLTSLEFAIVLIILGASAYVLLRGLLFIEGESERAAFEDNRVALERALSYELMSRGTHGETQNPALLAQQDPFQWLERKPLGWNGNYPAAGRGKPGGWYWDSRRTQVVYVPKNPRLVVFDDKRQTEIRLAIDAVGSGQARLVAVTPFAWR